MKKENFSAEKAFYLKIPSSLSSVEGRYYIKCTFNLVHPSTDSGCSEHVSTSYFNLMVLDSRNCRADRNIGGEQNEK